MLLYEYNLTGSSPRKKYRKNNFGREKLLAFLVELVWMRQQSSVHFFTSAFGIYGFGLCASCASQWVFFLLHFTSIRLEKCQNQNKSNSERGGNKSKRRRIGRKNSPHGIFDKNNNDTHMYVYKNNWKPTTMCETARCILLPKNESSLASDSVIRVENSR